MSKSKHRKMRDSHRIMKKQVKQLRKEPCEVCGKKSEVELTRPKFPGADKTEDVVQNICWQHAFAAMSFHVEQLTIKHKMFQDTIAKLEDSTFLNKLRKQLKEEIQRANDTYILYKNKMEPDVEYHSDYGDDDDVESDYGSVGGMDE